MKQATADHLAAAERSLAKAAAIISLPLFDEAGRSAYYAMYHAAQAFVVHRGFKSAKTHRGLRQLFARAVYLDASVQHLLTPLTNTYQHKWVADYDTTGLEVTEMEAKAALAEAAQFLASIRAALATPPPP